MVDAGAIAVIDGKDSMGQVLTAHAMEEPIRRSKARGIGAVGLLQFKSFRHGDVFHADGGARGVCRLSRDQCQSSDKASLLRPTRWPRSVREVYLLRILWPPEQFHLEPPSDARSKTSGPAGIVLRHRDCAERSDRPSIDGDRHV